MTFKVVEFDHFRQQAGLHTFVLSASEWIEKTGAIGIFVKKGRYGGTYAHKDIAFEFASAISPMFKLYLIKEFERLKELNGDNVFPVYAQVFLAKEFEGLDWRVYYDEFRELEKNGLIHAELPLLDEQRKQKLN